MPCAGPRQVDLVGALLSVLGLGGLVLGILVWQEGGESVGLLLALGAVALALLACGWCAASARASRRCSTPTSSGSRTSRPKMTLEYNALETGLTLAPLSLSMFGVALLAGRRAGRRRPSAIVLLGFALCAVGIAAIIPLVPRTDSGWALFVLLLITGSGLVSNAQLEPLLAAEPPDVQAEILRINKERGTAPSRWPCWCR